MCRKLIVWTALALAGSWICTTASAQPPRKTGFYEVPLFDGLSELGRNIFGPIAPPSKSPASDAPAPSPTVNRLDGAEPRGRTTLAESIRARMGSPAPGTTQSPPARTTPATRPNQKAPPWSLGSTGQIARRAGRPPAASSRVPQPSVSRTALGSASSATVARNPGTPNRLGPVTSPKRRIHERLELFRAPAFGALSERSGAPKPSSSAPTPEPADEAPAASQPDAPQPDVAKTESDDPVSVRQPDDSQPTEDRSDLATGQPAPQPTAGRPTLAPSRDGVRTAESPTPSVTSDSQTPPTVASTVTSSEQTPPAAPPDAPTPRAVTRDNTAPPSIASGRDVPSSVPASAPPGVEKPPAAPSPTPGDGSDVLFSRQSPILDVKTVGPRRITVGTESIYEVTISNSGPVAADDVVLTIELPDWADVQSAEPTAGIATPAALAVGGRPLRWTVGRLEAKGRERLTLRIVPRQSRPFDLAVKWGYTPITSQAVIEVQEPKLHLQFDGPPEVLYGKPVIYRLQISNSGNGDATNVELSLLPLGTDIEQAVTHKLGTLAAGQAKAIDVELTARQSGQLTVILDARGDAGAEAHLSEQIRVVKPALNVDVRAPAVRYVNSDATYHIHISNPGTTRAGNVTVTATIPTAAEYVSSDRNGQVDADLNEVTWTLNSLDSGAEETFALTCRLAQPGESRLAVNSVAEGGLTASTSAVTRVETMADLVLSVEDPVGPLAVGTRATYRLAIQNRGTQAARDVEVVTYFSRGIEPIDAEGGRHKMGAGQIVFEKIPSLAAGRSAAFEIHATAQTPGNHIVRVEVYCKESGVRLVTEESTHFYGDPVADRATPAGRNAFAETLETADRRQPTTAPSDISSPKDD